MRVETDIRLTPEIRDELREEVRKIFLEVLKDVGIKLSPELKEEIRKVATDTTEVEIVPQTNGEQGSQKEWMSLNEAASYAGVSVNTFKKFRDMGLPVSNPGGMGVHRVARTDIDEFLITHSKKKLRSI